jgi:hypothetical protein
LSGQNTDGFPIPNSERSDWDFLLGVTPAIDKGFFPTSTMEVFIAAHVDYVYHELFDELAEIRRL